MLKLFSTSSTSAKVILKSAKIILKIQNIIQLQNFLKILEMFFLN